MHLAQAIADHFPYAVADARINSNAQKNYVEIGESEVRMTLAAELAWRDLGSAGAFLPSSKARPS